jgi:hypothetical protein
MTNRADYSAVCRNLDHDWIIRINQHLKNFIATIHGAARKYNIPIIVLWFVPHSLKFLPFSQ